MLSRSAFSLRSIHLSSHPPRRKSSSIREASVSFLPSSVVFESTARPNLSSPQICCVRRQSRRLQWVRQLIPLVRLTPKTSRECLGSPSTPLFLDRDFTLQPSTAQVASPNSPSCAHWNGGGHSVRSATQVRPTPPSLLLLPRSCPWSWPRTHCGSPIVGRASTTHLLGGYSSKSLARPSSILDQLLMHAIQVTLQRCGSLFTMLSWG